MKDLFLLNYDDNPMAVLDARHEELPYHFHKKLLYAFVTQDNIVQLLKKYPHQKIGEFETISFNPSIYEVEINKQKITLCQAPLGAPAATQLLDWLIAYGVREILAVGSAGALEELPENKFFLVKKALRDEGTSLHYLPAQDFIDFDGNVMAKIQSAANDLQTNLQEVTTWTTDGFFRETKNKVIAAKELGCQLVEMESAALAACTQFRNAKFGQILFTADSLADIDKHDNRDWGKASQVPVVDLGLNILSKM